MFKMMQRLLSSRSRLLVGMLAVACIGVIGSSTGTAFASAGTITAPSSNPYVATYDSTGANLSYVTVSGTGFPDSTAMFVEVCDGVSPSAQGWDPTLDCDLGSSPGSAASDASGNVTFSSTDLNRRFRPFEGASPQGDFNCLGPSQTDPNNGLTSYTNCQIRVSSNNSAATDDQAFLTMTLPNPSAPGVPTTLKALSGSTTSTTGSMTVSFKTGSINGSPITNNTATCTSSNSGVTKSGTHATSPITVTGVSTGKTYTCKVKSTNAKGTGALSVASPAVIEGSPAPPTNVKAKTGSTTTTTGTLTVTFTAGATNGSALTSPTYTASCVSSNSGAARTVTGTSTTIAVTGATTAKTYTCTVKEHNARGYGLASAPSLAVIVGSPAPPATPTVTNTSSGVLRVAFTLLTSAQANGSALTTPKYTATCTSSNGGLTKSMTGTTTPISVSALTAGRTYTCTVKAHNVRGYGLSSPASTAHTA